jgi:hypothetical protein
MIDESDLPIAVQHCWTVAPEMVEKEEVAPDDDKKTDDGKKASIPRVK